MSILLAAVIGAAAGVLSGMGIGGGTLLVLYLTAVLDIAASTAAGINLFYFLCCAPASLFFHARDGLINKSVAVAAAISGSITALIAALLVPDNNPDWLRRAFGVLLLVVGARELWLVIRAWRDQRSRRRTK